MVKNIDLLKPVLILTLTILALPRALAVPPYSGTIFLEPDIITSSDPTTYTGMIYTGQGMRLMFDRRVADFVNLNAHLFDASFSDGPDVEIQVNPEFDVSTATAHAETYAPVIGRLPTALRADLQTVWIHDGNQPFGGGNNNLLIHTVQGDNYIASGILEETFVHEACHTSLDAAHANSAGWLNAQSSDPDFISTYAEDNPTQEDIAESFLMYFAAEYQADRISPSMLSTITTTIPNRIAYFNAQSFDLYPYVAGIGPTDVVYVDFAYTGAKDGAQTTPWNALEEALGVVDPGGIINIKGDTGDGDSSETLTINQDVTINAVNGAVTIGGPPSRSSSGDVSGNSGFVSRTRD